MHTAESLQDVHRRSHDCLGRLLGHCQTLSSEQLHRACDGFGDATIQLQLHHVIAAEQYWVGVLEGRIAAADDAHLYPTVDALAAFRVSVAAGTEAYLRGATVEELNTHRPMRTWGGAERRLLPAQIILRTQTHLFHHQGQILAMCRLLGRPATGFDYPID